MRKGEIQMKWFVVSLISTIEVIDKNQEPQSTFPVFEDFVLISAHNEAELQEKIQSEIALINRAGASGVRYHQIPAIQRCLGVRKIRAIYNLIDAENNEPPTDRTELTHSYMEVASLADAQLLADGKSVYVQYIDDDAESA